MAGADLVIGGFHAVRAALERAPADCRELWLRRDRVDAQSAALEFLATTHGVATHRVDAVTLERLYEDPHHQGVVLRRRVPAVVDLKTWLAGREVNGAPALLLVLDQVQDPRNFGACLRVADGAGVDAVIFPRDKSARLGNVLAKAASGALDTVTLVAVANLAAALRELRAAGVWLTGASHDAVESLYEIDFTGASAIVLGNEGSGLRRLTKDLCDRTVSIPMSGGLASLNVGTAAAVCLFEARRQRLAVARAVIPA